VSEPERKKLIEVTLPLEATNRESAREWENTTNEDVLAEARAQIHKATDGNPPPVRLSYDWRTLFASAEKPA
jgi:hypothetical protein